MILFTIGKSDFSCVSQVWSMNRSSLSRYSSLLRLASLILLKQKCLLDNFRTWGCLTKHRSWDSSSACLSLTPLSSLFPLLLTDRSSVVMVIVVIVVALCSHTIWELKCWVWNQLPPFFYPNFIVILFQVLVTLENLQYTVPIVSQLILISLFFHCTWSCCYLCSLNSEVETWTLNLETKMV